jgi:hypothetical protein
LECPGEDELSKVEACNVDACPLARVDKVRTFPESPDVLEPFQLFVDGEWLEPDQDRILLINEGAACGTQLEHFGGASCMQEGSVHTGLVCGDGKNSIKVQRAGRYRICVCDASSSVIQSFDGGDQNMISVGSNEGAGLDSVGCKDGRFYLLEPSQKSVIQVGALGSLSPVGDDVEDSSGSSNVVQTSDSSSCDEWY